MSERIISIDITHLVQAALGQAALGQLAPGQAAGADESEE